MKLPSVFNSPSWIYTNDIRHVDEAKRQGRHVVLLDVNLDVVESDSDFLSRIEHALKYQGKKLSYNKLDELEMSMTGLDKDTIVAIHIHGN